MHLPRWVVGLIGAALIFVSGVVDWVTGPEMAFSVLYLVPVGFVAWRGGRWLGITTAMASGAMWLFVELMTHTTAYSRAFIPYWNGSVRLTIFCLVAVLISEVAERKRVEGELRKIQEELGMRVQERTAQLQSLNETLEQRVAERSAAVEERARKLAKSEADLERQRGILQSVLDSMGEGVVVADATGKLLLFNPAAEQMLGISACESRPVTWLEFQQRYLRDQPDVEPGSEHLLARAMQGEVLSGVELFLNRPDHPNGLWLLVSGRSWFNAAGAISGSVTVLTDITARRNLERQIAEISDREQRRLGQDLHDGLCQHLASVSFAARMLSDKLGERYLPEAEDAARIAELLSESISQAKDIARGLYPVQLEVGGLSSALEELAAQVRSSSGLPCAFIDRTVLPAPDGLASTDLFRIAQEAVNNAVKHARAKHVTITLDADEEQLALTVEDDGCGLPVTLDKSRGMGLHIMNYRAHMIGATCSIKTKQSGGTVVLCSLPLPNAKTGVAHAK